MLPTFCIENQIRELMERIRLTPTVLGQLASLYGMSGFSQTRICQAFNGVKRFEDHKGQRLLEFVREIEQLVAVADFPLSLNDPEQIKQLLDARRAMKTAAKYDQDAVREILGVE